MLIQGIADVDYRDLDANRERYLREVGEKLPATKELLPPAAVQRMFGFYFNRVYVHVRPERVYVWPEGDSTREPQLFDAHMEEVRSGHDEEPERPPPPAEGGPGVWDGRMDELGARYPRRCCRWSLPTASRSACACRSRWTAPRCGSASARAPSGVPVQPGLACLTAHDHDPDFRWQRNFQVRGDLVEEDGAWAFVPKRLIGGFELPPVSKPRVYAMNARKMVRFWRTAKKTRRELSA